MFSGDPPDSGVQPSQEMVLVSLVPSFAYVRVLYYFVKAHEDLIANGIIIQLNKF